MAGGCISKAFLRVAVISIMVLSEGRRSLVASALAPGRMAAASALVQMLSLQAGCLGGGPGGFRGVVGEGEAMLAQPGVLVEALLERRPGLLGDKAETKIGGADAMARSRERSRGGAEELGKMILVDECCQSSDRHSSRRQPPLTLAAVRRRNLKEVECRRGGRRLRWPAATAGWLRLRVG